MPVGYETVDIYSLDFEEFLWAKLDVQRNIVRSYENDMVKYAEGKNKAFIKECFESIPRQLAKENKKFQFSSIKKGGTAQKYSSGSKMQELLDVVIT